MKKYIFLLALLMAVLGGCGIKDTDSTNNTLSESEEISQIDEVADNKDSADEEAMNSEKEESEEPYDWAGILMPVPEEFKNDYETSGVFGTYRCETDTYSMFYGMDSMMYYDDTNDDNKEYTVHDVPEIIFKKFNEMINNYFPSDRYDLENSVIKSEETDFLGFPALHVTGLLNTAFDDEKHTVSYSVYYGIFDFSDNNSVHTPSFWICFAEGDDDALRTKLEEASALPLKQAKLK